MTGADGAGINECKESGAPAGPAGPRAPLTPVSLGPAELQACLALDRLCLGGLWSAQQWRTELADPQRVGLGLMQAGRLLAIACAWLIVDELHITLVAVDPAHRRRGLAQGLLRALLQRGRELGAAPASCRAVVAPQEWPNTTTRRVSIAARPVTPLTPTASITALTSSGRRRSSSGEGGGTLPESMARCWLLSLPGWRGRITVYPLLASRSPQPLKLFGSSQSPWEISTRLPFPGA